MRLPHRRPFVLTATVAVLVATAAACSDSDNSDAEDDHSSTAPTEAIALWEETDEVLQTMLTDLEHIYKQCMETAGFDTHPDGLLINQSDQQAPWDDVLTSSTVTAPLLEDAQENGYGAAPNDIEESESSEFLSLAAEERSAYWIELRGYDPNDTELDTGQLPDHEVVSMPDGSELQFPTVGCQAEGDDIVFAGDKASYLETKYVVRDRLFGIVFEDVSDHESYTAAVGEWSDCMSDLGYSVETPLQARNTASDIWYHTDDLSDAEFDARKADEIELATHHAECADDTELREAHETVLWDAVDTYLVDHDDELQAWVTIVDDAASQAEAHLDAS